MSTPERLCSQDLVREPAYQVHHAQLIDQWLFQLPQRGSMLDGQLQPLPRLAALPMHRTICYRRHH